MKQLVLFLCLLVLLTPFASFAEEPMARGQVVGKGTKLPIYTDKELDEALRISDECKSYDYSNVRFDCDCVGMTYLELRRKQGETAPSYWLRETARRKCPNGPAMAGKVYTQCLQWAPSRRGDDYQEFCACFGSNFAKAFTKNPTDNLLITEVQTVKAMESCNVNSVNVKAQDRAAFVQKLKENNTYDKLFPGAKDDPAEIKPNPILQPKIKQ
jgi:hypothetical protein